MALAARGRGYRFLVVTDHSHYLREGRLHAQWEEIAAVDERLRPFRVLRGVEANIRVDGSVDVPDDEAGGGDLVFAFEHPLDLESITLVDIDDRVPSRVHLAHEGGGTTSLNLLNQGDGSVQELELALFAHEVTRLTVELGGPRGWVAIVPFVLALAIVIAAGVWTSRRRITRSDVAVAVAAVASWGLLILVASVGG